MLCGVSAIQLLGTAITIEAIGTEELIARPAHPVGAALTASFTIHPVVAVFTQHVVLSTAHGLDGWVGCGSQIDRDEGTLTSGHEAQRVLVVIEAEIRN